MRRELHSTDDRVHARCVHGCHLFDAGVRRLRDRLSSGAPPSCDVRLHGLRHHVRGRVDFVRGNCVDTMTDPNNCGGCSTKCVSPSNGIAECSGGVCVRTCPGGTVDCSGDCVDTTRDVLNCGACGITCAGPCVASTCTPALSSVLATGSTPTALAADGSYVYWLDPGASKVFKTSADSAATTTELANGQASPFDIAIDVTYVYWTNKLGAAVMRVAKSGGTPEILSGAVSPLHIALDATYVYWNDSVGVRRVAKTGGSPVTIAADGTEVSGLVPVCVEDIAIDASTLYLGVGEATGCKATSGIWHRASDGSGTTTLVTSLCSGPPMTVTRSAIWCNAYDLDEVSKSGLLLQSADALGDLVVTTMTLSPEYLYASACRSSYVGEYCFYRGTYRLPLCGGPGKQINSVTGEWSAIDDLYVYMSGAVTGDKNIYRSPR